MIRHGGLARRSRHILQALCHHQAQSSGVGAQANDLVEMECLVIALREQLLVTSGDVPPAGVTRLVFRLLKDRLADIKGPGPTNPRLGPTKTAPSPT